MGLISDNHEFDNDILLNEREKKLINNISKDVLSIEEAWKNYDVEETSIKLILSDLVLDQLFNEVIEILEHVNLSREKPELYQSKSIYACEDIPKLAFQQTEENINEPCDNNEGAELFSGQNQGSTMNQSSTIFTSNKERLNRSIN